MIHAEDLAVAVLVGVGAGDPVVGRRGVDAGKGRQGSNAVKVLGQGGLERGWNLVIRERLTRIIVGGVGRGVGIVNGDVLQRRVGQAAEIAAAMRGRRHRCADRSELPQVIFRESKEEECAVLAVVNFRNVDRAAHGGAEQILNQEGRRSKSALPLTGDAGDAVVFVGLISLSVQRVGPGLSDHDDCAGTIKLGGRIERIDLDFRDVGSFGRRALRATLGAVGLRAAVDCQFGRVVAQTISARTGAAALESRRGGSDQPHGVAHRELLDARTVQPFADGGSGGIDHWCDVAYGHLRRSGAHFERDVHRRGESRLQHDLSFPLFHPGCGYGDLVGADRRGREHVESGSVGLRFLSDGCVHLREGYIGVGHNRSGRVGDCALNGGAAGLREHRRDGEAGNPGQAAQPIYVHADLLR